jgi:hypothetical protein
MVTNLMMVMMAVMTNWADVGVTFEINKDGNIIYDKGLFYQVGEVCTNYYIPFTDGKNVLLRSQKFSEVKGSMIKYKISMVETNALGEVTKYQYNYINSESLIPLLNTNRINGVDDVSTNKPKIALTPK